MTASANTIISRALAKAKVPAYVLQAQAELNLILSELCQNVDLSVARGLVQGTFNPGQTTVVNGVTIFGGPIALPADYLRTSGSTGSSGAQKSAYWMNLGVPYPMVPCDLAEFDMQVQQSGTQSYPWLWATDMSQAPPVAYVYPPPSGAYPFFVRYQRQMPDITDFTQVPWFPDARFLIQELTGRMMEDTDDTRSQYFLGDSENGSRGILRRYLKLKDDSTNRTDTVQMDRRSFGSAFSRLRNTKVVGW
jgi:hypothetical protein